MNPMRISEGYYTTIALNPSDDGAFSDPCPPGRWRNASETKDYTLKTPSRHDDVSRASYPECQLCPSGTFKQVNGDSISLCRPCDNVTMTDEEDRVACTCLREPGGRTLEDDEVLVFNYTRSSNKAVCSAVNHSRVDEVLAKFAKLFNGTQYTKRSQTACEPGYWCRGGVRRPCAPGRYGDARRETRSECAGECSPGFYCPEASTSSTQVRCGPDRYCPAGSSVPRPFGRGSYAVEVEHGVPSDVYTRQAPCPAGSYCIDAIRYPCAAGRYGSQTHANYSNPDCEGPCERGYLCPRESTSPRQKPCGHPAVVCPTGSYEPIDVPDGYYSIHTGADADERAFHDPHGKHMDAFLPCEPGYYCKQGIKYACPPFRYGWRYMQTSAECDGAVAPGCYAPQPQGGPLLSDCPEQCGGIDVYCPPTGREKRPTLVSPGYYAVGGTNTTRTGQEPCPPGTSCANGVITNCPAGRYQPLAGQVRCDNACPPGSFCPEGSAEPAPCPVGTFSLGLVEACTACPYFDGQTEQTCFDDRYCCPEFTT